MDKRQLIKICLVLFAIAIGVRLLVWQNNRLAIGEVQWGVTKLYIDDARNLVRGDLKTFLSGPNPPSDATILLHPPGYPILLAAVYAVFGESQAVVVIQILLNSFAPILVFLIALSLFDVRTVVIAGVIVAVGPQFAYYSSVMLPDALSVVLILAAVYAIVRAISKPRLSSAVLCGVSIGISCWLRSNALLLPIFFAVAAFVLLPKQIRVRFALILVASFVLTISPITIRNLIVFKSFVPVSLGFGTTFVEGLGDYDSDGRLGLPKTDQDVLAMDALFANRADYNQGLLNPDGVERERARVKFGLTVVRDNPVWYLTTVAKRGLSTVRMERVPVIAPERDEADTTNPVLYKLNIPLKLFQRLFITAVIFPLLFFGIILLLRESESRRTLAILAIVPLYFMTVQPLIHTEYRYVLAIPHIGMIVSAVALTYVWRKVVNRFQRSSDTSGLAV